MNTDAISNDARATVKNLRSFYGKFPQVVRIENGLERLMDFRCLNEEPECLAVIGETGTGKSTILNRFACRYPRVTHAEFTEVPVLLVPVPAKCTIKLLSAEALAVMGSPFAAKGNEVELTTQLLTLLAACRTRVIIFDEVNHLSDRGGQKSHYLVGDWIKSLSYKSKLPIVLVGTPAAQVLWRTNEQLGDRFHEAIHLRALTHVEDDLVELKTVLKAFSKVAGSFECVDFQDNENAAAMAMASGGRLRNIRSLYVRAVEIAARESVRVISRKTFAQAFRERIFSGCPDSRNPFTAKFDGKALAGTGEPFAPRSKS